MGKIKNKLIDWKNRLKDRHMLSIIVVLFSIIIVLGIYTYKSKWIIGKLQKIHIIWHFTKS